MPDIPKDPALRHEPGIYFYMSEEEYHADMAIGSSDIKKLATRPWEWQRDRMRPRPERYVSEAKRFGSALHCRVLEGKAAFEERYAVKPKPEQFGEPGRDVLVTIDHLREFLRSRSAPVSKKNKGELLADVRGYLDRPVLFDDVIEEWSKTPRVQAGYEISLEDMVDIEDATFFMESDETLRAVMAAGSLIGGAAEVSVFYEADGFRRKARFDYALPPIGALTKSTIVDLKSFSQFRGANSEDAALHALVDMNYDIQFVDYMRAFGFASKLAAEGKVFGNEPFSGYIDDLFGAAQVQWIWIMVHKDGGFVPVVLTIEQDESYRRDIHFQAIESMCDDAIANLVHHLDEFGGDQLWPPPSRTPLRVSGSVLPVYRKR